MAFSLSGILSLNTSGFMKGISQAKGETQKLGSTVKNTSKNLAGIATGLAGFVGVGVGIKDTIDTFSNFQKEMSNVKAITDETSDEAMKMLSEKAKEMGRILPASASDAAKAMANLGSAGFSTDEIMKSIEGTLYLATAAQTDMATAADISSSTLRGFGLEASKASHVSDVLAKTASATNAGIIDMGESLKYSAPAAKAAGWALEEVAAATGLMANAGIKGSQSGTTLRGAIVRLTKPAKPAIKVMKSMGFSAFDSSGKMKNLGTIIGELQDKTKGMTQENKNQAIATIFGTEALSGMLTLMDAGPSKINELTGALEKSDGASKKMAETQTNNLYGAMQELDGAFETAKINIGEKAAPIITDAIKGIADKLPSIADKAVEVTEELIKTIKNVYNWIKDNSNLVSDAIVGVGAAFVTAKGIIIGSQILSTVKNIFFAIEAYAGGAATFMEALAFATGVKSATALKIGLVAGVVAILAIIVYECYKHWDGVKAATSQLVSNIGVAFFNLGVHLKNIFAGIGNFFIDNVVNPIINGINKIPFVKLDKVSRFGYGTTKEYGSVVDAFKEAEANKKNANGTSYFTGGTSLVNERGGEMQVLRNGTSVIPADRTKEMIEGNSNKPSQNVNINIDARGMSVDELVNKLQLTLKTV